MGYENEIMKVEEYDVLVVEKKMKEDFETIGEFSEEGYARVSIGDRKGVINANGELIIPCEYKDVFIYGKYAEVEDENGLRRAIDLETKKQVLECKDEKIVKISGKYALVGNIYGPCVVIDLKTQKKVLKCKHNIIDVYGKYVLVRDEPFSYVVIDLETKKKVLKCNHKKIAKISGNYAEIQDETGLSGVIDLKTQKKVLKCKYVLLTISGKYALVEGKNNVVIDLETKEQIVEYDHKKIVKISGKYALVEGKNDVVIDLETKEQIVECEDEKIVKIYGKYAVVTSENNGLKNLIDLETGKTILEGFLNTTNMHEDRIAVQMSEKVWKLMDLKTQQEVIEREYITNINDADVSMNSYLKNPTRKMEVYSKKGLSVNGHMVVFENELERMEYIERYFVGPAKVYKKRS